MHLSKCCYSQFHIDRAHLVPDTMDIVLEDAGDHSRRLQELLFPLLWPLVRPGGWYIIEDVDPQRGGDDFTQNHSALLPMLQRVLETHRSFLVESTPGITGDAWQKWMAHGNSHPVKGRVWVPSRRVHNSHLLIIKRINVSVIGNGRYM